MSGSFVGTSCGEQSCRREGNTVQCDPARCSLGFVVVKTKVVFQCKGLWQRSDTHCDSFAATMADADKIVFFAFRPICRLFCQNSSNCQILQKGQKISCFVVFLQVLFHYVLPTVAPPLSLSTSILNCTSERGREYDKNEIMRMVLRTVVDGRDELGYDSDRVSRIPWSADRPLEHTLRRSISSMRRRRSLFPNTELSNVNFWLRYIF